jgi:transcriptional regulator GlxA family with amidase domain
MNWARERLDQPITVGLLAARAAMSERNFFSAILGSHGHHTEGLAAA